MLIKPEVLAKRYAVGQKRLRSKRDQEESIVGLIKFYVRGESRPHYIYFPEIMVSLTEIIYEVRFDVGVKEVINCCGSYKWKLIHQETGEVIIVDTETVFRDVSSFYEYRVGAKYGPKIYVVKKC